MATTKVKALLCARFYLTYWTKTVVVVQSMEITFYLVRLLTNNQADQQNSLLSEEALPTNNLLCGTAHMHIVKK